MKAYYSVYLSNGFVLHLSRRWYDSWLDNTHYKFFVNDEGHRVSINRRHIIQIIKES